MHDTIRMERVFESVSEITDWWAKWTGGQTPTDEWFGQWHTWSGEYVPQKQQWKDNLPDGHYLMQSGGMRTAVATREVYADEAQGDCDECHAWTYGAQGHRCLNSDDTAEMLRDMVAVIQGGDTVTIELEMSAPILNVV